MNPPSAETTTRIDIQALRGLAVLLVVFYHARLGQPVAGYLGLDIFFVISGFLITGLVRKRIERGDFRFTQFYFQFRCSRRQHPHPSNQFPMSSA